MPDSFAEEPNGLLMVANGFQPMLRWDSLTSQAEPAGVLPPTAAPSLTASGVGAIVGTYFAFVRFVDRFGNLSNLSPISARFTASGTTGAITNATAATPIVITSAAHGLTTGSTVKITGVGGTVEANNTWTITVIDGNSFSLNNSTSNNAYNGSGTWISGVSVVTYSGVQLPTEAKVARRQILRNTDGQTQTFYVDIDTADLTSTSFSSTLADTFLQAGIAQAILDPDGSPLADIYTVPPNHKGVIAFHLARMFAAVEYDYTAGSVQPTFGSQVVQGIGTEWTSSLAGRFLYVVGALVSYEILSVDAVNQVITLTAPYQDVTDKFALYAIRPAPAERRLVYYSESGLPEAWPATNAISVQEDGDEITGLMPMGSFLYILERRHVYRFTFQSDPASGGAIFLSSLRGCINSRCWALVDDTAYMLDEQGIHAFGGGQESEPVSNPIQGIFRPGSDSAYRINWQAAQWFHAVHYQPQETVRWFVALSGSSLPRHALCYNYRLKRWWIEEFTRPIGASVHGRINGVPQVFLGSSARRIFAMWQGTLDGPDPSAGTVRGTVTQATLTSLTDALASYAASGLVGSPVSIVYGTGKYQTRTITQVSGLTLSVDRPWMAMPDTTSIYQIGGVHWRFQAGWFRFAQDEEENERRFEFVFQPLANPATMDARIRLDFSDAAYQWGIDRTSADGNGVETRSGSTDLVIDLTKKTGIAMQRFPSHKEFYLDGKRYAQPELEGFTNTDQVSVYQVTVDGVIRPAGGP